MVTMEAQALDAYLQEVFPQLSGYRIEVADGESVRVRLNVADRHLRPGGTVSGPTMFELADVAVYGAILSRIGKVPLAVTTNASIDFMRKPEAGRNLAAVARLLKLGRTLAVGDVLIFSDGQDQPVARCSLTYSIPPRR